LTTSKLHRIVLLLLGLAGLALLEGCGGAVDLSGKSARELFDQGMDKYQRRKYLTAVNCFQTLVYNYPGESNIDSAQYFLALSYYSNEEYALAAVEFNRLLINYPQSIFAQQSQLMKAVCQFEGSPKSSGLDQTDLEPAIAQFEDFVIDYPESEAIDDAQRYLSVAKSRMAEKFYRSGVVYIRLSDYRAAKIYFQRVVDDYTSTDFAALSAYQLAECDFKQKKWDSADVAFDRFSRAFPSHQWVSQAAQRSCEAAFKGGQEAFKAGDYALARTRFERFKAISTDNGKRKKADEYLGKMPVQPVAGTQGDNGGS
jgi:outer membrane protein assembly factor BamD